MLVLSSLPKSVDVFDANVFVFYFFEVLERERKEIQILESLDVS